MRTKQIRRAVAVAASAAAVVAGTALTQASAETGQPGHGHDHGDRIRHVLLISVDGLHQQDLAWYVKTYPHSVLAGLDRRGLEYSRAQTPFPSDSFPGMVGQVTGGDPRVTGIYYDDTWNHDVFPAGTTNCPGAPPGGEVAYTEAVGHQPGLDRRRPGPDRPARQHPADDQQPAGRSSTRRRCRSTRRPASRSYPNQYLKVNTIFNVARQHGLRTAWSDKHPAYQMLPGRRATGVAGLLHARDQQPGARLLRPAGTGPRDNAATMQYDSYKVQAILNEIDGYDHSGTQQVGTPAIFGMNFQTVSTAQKLPTSDGLTGGYLPGGQIPGPLLARALELHQRRGRRDGRRDQGPTGWPAAPRSSSPPSTASRRPTRPPWPGFPTARSSAPSTRPGRRRTRARATWWRSPPTTTGCCCG